MSIENSIVFNFMKQTDDGRATFACETCRGDGGVDESLGGLPRSGVVKCPDCNGWGFHWEKQR